MNHLLLTVVIQGKSEDGSVKTEHCSIDHLTIYPRDNAAQKLHEAIEKIRSKSKLQNTHVISVAYCDRF